MKIYSDILTRRDLYEALPAGMMIEEITEIEKPRTRNIHTGEKFQRGWILYCSGSSSRPAQHGFGNYSGYNAATWDEYGIWMDALYQRDPEARISWYKTYEDFIQYTTHARNYYANEHSKNAREHRAPWLDKVAA